MDIIKDLVLKKRKDGFLANKITLICSKCSRSEKITYYELLKKQQFELLEPMSVPDTIIREFQYDEEITATPIKFKIQCPHCGGQMETYSPVPMEYILNILQSPPPDEIMYG